MLKKIHLGKGIAVFIYQFVNKYFIYSPPKWLIRIKGLAISFSSGNFFHGQLIVDGVCMLFRQSFVRLHAFSRIP